jgi:hypothetical protein
MAMVTVMVVTTTRAMGGMIMHMATMDTLTHTMVATATVMVVAAMDM